MGFDDPFSRHYSIMSRISSLSSDYAKRQDRSHLYLDVDYISSSMFPRCPLPRAEALHFGGDSTTQRYEIRMEHVQDVHMCAL